MINHTNNNQPRRFSQRWKRTAWVGLFATVLLSVACTTIGPSFGSLPSGERQTRIEHSPNFRDGEFKYLEYTDVWTGGGQVSYLKQTFFGESKQTAPANPLPITWTDLANLDINRDVVVWLGHSSIYLQIGGKRILIDPVLNGHASPLPFIAKAFKGTYPYTAEKMPVLDYVVISHDHWDHLDYPTLIAIRSKVKAVVTPLGVGAYLESWGYAREFIHEGDWNDQIALEPNITFHVLPARHFSGRGLSENKTQWAGFLIETPNRKVFYSGDGGYGPHFADIGKRFGSIDLALIENGQYDPHWAQMHLMPEEAAQVAVDVHAKRALPVHAGRFDLASHAWDDPYERIAAASQNKNFQLTTPKIGDVVELENPNQTFSQWWKLQ